MDAQAFSELALRVIAREADDDDRRVLQAEMVSTPVRREEFEQIKANYNVLRATAPLTEAGQTSATELPAHRVGELRTAVRQHFGPVTAKAARKAEFQLWPHVLRWVFGGGGLAAGIFALVMFCYANQTVEVGFYGSDLARTRGYGSLTPQDFSTAKLLAFDQDATFDAWQNAPLAWYEHAKVWVDNEHDLLVVTHRVRHGQVITETQPLAPTDAAQREQIKRVVAGLEP